MDGQQRITAGLALYHGVGKSQYFLDLENLWDLAQKVELDFDSPSRLAAFANDLDEMDGYLIGRKASANPDALLDSHRLLEMHEVAEVVVAPSIKTDGKHYQLGLE